MKCFMVTMTTRAQAKPRVTNWVLNHVCKSHHELKCLGEPLRF